MVCMNRTAMDFSFEEYCEVIEQFSPCMNDYLYFYDIEQDLYYISEHALERFALPSNLFTDVAEMHRQFVYEDDVDELIEDLGKMVSGEKDEHNIEYRWMGIDGSPIWINCRGRVVKDENDKPKYMLGCVNEIGKRQRADNISGLKEFHAVSDVFETVSSISCSGYLLHIGIDDFKSINERFGYDYGDLILRAVAECIEDALDIGEEVYRMTADEFIVVDYLADSEKAGEDVYNKIRDKIDIFIEKKHYETVFTISGGILSLNELAGLEAKELLKLSQFSLEQAKKNGKNQVYYFDFGDYELFLQQKNILSCIREAVATDFQGFEVYYQPIVHDNNVYMPYAAEALLRYTMPGGRKISPFEFIPVLEESGLIIPVGKWVLAEAMKFCKKVQMLYPEFKVNVNVSYVQVLKSPFLTEFFRMLKEYELSPTSIVIELTESGQFNDSSQLHRIWDNLRKYGVSIALDDFGTGYSNLMNISDITPYIVKLDRGFTIKALHNHFERELMANIIKMIHSIGLKICVEGIETEEELIQIRTLSPDYIQGYYYGKPCPEEEFYKQYC